MTSSAESKVPPLAEQCRAGHTMHGVLVICNQRRGHAGEHIDRRPDGVEWVWPQVPAAALCSEHNEAPGMVTIRQDDLEHLLDWHNKPCGDADDVGMFERLLAAIPREADDAD